MKRSPLGLLRAAALCAAAILALAACARPPPPLESEPIAVNTVQREIKVGMDQPSVLQALGAPSSVSTDSQRRETWTYDKIPSDRVDTESSIGGGLIIRGDGERSRESSANDRTLTIIIYYDDAKKVREFAYNYSSL